MARQPRRLQLRRSILSLQTLEDRSVPSSVQGTVFNDANNNGAFDPGETGVTGWTVFVDNNQNTIIDPGEVSATTDVNGNYFIDTTSVPPNSNGYHYFGHDLQVGSGGRWLNTTVSTVGAHPVNEPAAVRNFGVHFEPYVSVQPDGPETLVNTTTTNNQVCPAVSSDSAGNYVVAWNEWDHAVTARVFNADGTPRTGEITVTSVGNLPRVAMAGNGRFVVAWGNGTVSARVYNANGTPATGVITVSGSNSGGTGSIMGGVAMDGVGNFAVIYETHRGGIHPVNHVVQRYTAAGAPIGKPIRVDSTLRWGNAKQGIAMKATGEFVVAWDHGDSDGFFVYAQRYSASGQAVGSRIMVTTAPGSDVHWQSDVSINDSGRFAVTWTEYGTGFAKAQVYDWGTPVGGNLTLGSTPNGEVARDVDAAGNVTFAWPTTTTYSGPTEIAFRRFTAAGVLEPVYLANATTQGGQSHGDFGSWIPNSLTATGNDRFVVAWEGYGLGDDQGIFAQRFGPMSAPRPMNGASPVSKAFLFAVGLPQVDSEDEFETTNESSVFAKWWFRDLRN